MSEQTAGTQQTPEQPLLPEPAVAYQNIFDGVHGQVFFGKLASAGVSPQTSEETQSLLVLAGRLRKAEHVKQAGDRFGRWLPVLDELMGPDEQVKIAQAQDESLAIREAARVAASDPTIYNSVLALKAHEASMAG